MYEYVQGLGQMMVAHGGGGALIGGQTSSDASRKLDSSKLSLLSKTFTARTPSTPPASSEPPLRSGAERIPASERQSFARWYHSKYGLQQYNSLKRLDPNWTQGPRPAVIAYRTAKARAAAMANSGVAVMKGAALSPNRLAILQWWKRCDVSGTPQAWATNVSPQIPDQSVPMRLLQHFESIGFPASPPCPGGTPKKQMFRLDIGDPGWGGMQGAGAAPSVQTIQQIGNQAQQQSGAADIAAGRIKSLEDQIAALQSTLDAAQSAGAPSAEVQGLQQQVADLTAALSAAQQEHVAASQAAAELHREEMGMLQMQIAELASAMSAAQAGAAGGNGAAAAQVAQMQAQIAMLQEQLAAAAQAAQAEEQAAAETAAAANGGGFFAQHRNTLLLAGAALLAAGAAYWFFIRRKPAAGLPAPVTAASPSGLAANPRYPGTLVRSYSYKHPKTGKTVKVKGHRRAPAQRKMTKAQMKKKGWVYDIYTGKSLVEQDVRTDYGPRYSGSGTSDLPAAMPGDVKMIVRTMAESAKKYGGHLGEDDTSVYWSQWDDGTWVVGDNAERIKDDLIKAPNGTWYWRTYRGLTAKSGRRKLSKGQAKREAARYFEHISEYAGW